MSVHNHGPEGGFFATDLPDITCPERRMPDGSLRGACMPDDLDPAAVEQSTAAEVLTLHQRHTPSACLCGWSRLGHSFTQHQADMLAAAGLLVTPEHSCWEALIRDARQTASFLTGCIESGSPALADSALRNSAESLIPLVERLAAALAAAGPPVTPEHDAQVAARAWDEGWEVGREEAETWRRGDTPNPYRIERQGQGR